MSNSSHYIITSDETRKSLAGWQEILDTRNNKYYYYNPITGQTSWLHPTKNEIKTVLPKEEELPKEEKNDKKKKKRRTSIYFVYQSILKTKYDDCEGFTPKEKFLLLHLSHLVSEPGSNRRIDLEKEILDNPFLCACFKGDFDFVLKAVTENPKIIKETTPKSKLTCVHLCSAGAYIDIVQYFVDSDQSLADVPAANNLTPLHITCYLGLQDLATYLLKKKANPMKLATVIPYGKAGTSVDLGFQYITASYAKFGGSNALMFSIMGGNQIMVEYFVSKYGIQSEGLLVPPLFMAIIYEHEKLVQYLLKQNVDVNYVDGNGVNALMLLAMISDNGKIVKYLLEKKANINQQNRNTGDTPLHIAIKRGCLNFIKNLLKQMNTTEELVINHSIVNTLDKKTPIQLAISSELPEEIKKKILVLLKTYSGTMKKTYSQIIKEGYLIKEGHIVKNWKTRWFILYKDKLIYYKTIKRLKEPRGIITLTNAELIENFENKIAFTVVDRVNSKTYRIKAKDEKEAKEWIDALKYCITVTAK